MLTETRPDYEQIKGFLSYTQADNKKQNATDQKGRIDRIHDILDHHYSGQIFYAKHTINPTEDWKHKIDEALDEARILVAALSRQSIASNWVSYEVNTFVEHQKTDSSRKIIAMYLDPQLSIDDIRVFSWKLYTVQGIKAYPETFDAALEKLDRTLQNQFIKNFRLPIKADRRIWTLSATAPRWATSQGSGSQRAMREQSRRNTTWVELENKLRSHFSQIRIPHRFETLHFRPYVSGRYGWILPPTANVRRTKQVVIGSKSEEDLLTQPNEWWCCLDLDPFHISLYPVTVLEYLCAVIEEPNQFLPASPTNAISWEDQLQHLDHPVVNISWEQAVRYTYWLNNMIMRKHPRSRSSWRLPTEAEWECAARWDAHEGIARIYPWGNTFDDRLVHLPGNIPQSLTAIGTFRRIYDENRNCLSDMSPANCSDMASGVHEWTSTRYLDSTYVFDDFRENITDHTVIRTIKGASYLTDKFNIAARCAFRSCESPDRHKEYIGMRLALSTR